MRTKCVVLFLSVLVGSCGSLPALDICISNGKDGFDCTDKDEEYYFLPMEKSENYTALSPEDLELLINFIEKECDTE